MERLPEFSGGLRIPIAEALSYGHVARYTAGKAAVLRQDTTPSFSAAPQGELVKINVEAVVVAAALVEPAAGGIDQASRKAAFQDGGQAGSLELPQPSLKRT